MFPEPTELLLIGYSIESIRTQKSKSNVLTPQNQLADMLTKGTFTRDEWNHLLCLFHMLAISVLQIVLKWCQKRTQEESGEERVTAKSRPMMRLIERAPAALSSSASEIPGKTRYESQSPLSMQAEKYDRTGKPVVCRDTNHEHHHHRPVESTHSASYSEWNVDKAWFSQDWKSDLVMGDRTGKPVVCPLGGAHAFQSRTSSWKKKKITIER